MNFQQQISADSKDNNSCTVFALAACLNITYEQAQQKWNAFGRMKDRGVMPYDIHEFLSKEGFKLRFDLCRITLKNLLFLVDDDKSYFCVTIDHAFAIVKAVVKDNLEAPTRFKVKVVYERVE